MRSDFWKSVAFWRVSKLRPFVLLVRVTDGIILTRENRSTWRKNLSLCHVVHHKTGTTSKLYEKPVLTENTMHLHYKYQLFYV
jgi:hypothetical protein